MLMMDLVTGLVLFNELKISEFHHHVTSESSLVGDPDWSVNAWECRNSLVSGTRQCPLVSAWTYAQTLSWLEPATRDYDGLCIDLLNGHVFLPGLVCFCMVTDWYL